MQLSEIDRKIIANLHSLPLKEQQSLLEYSLLLKSKTKKHKLVKKNKSSFGVKLEEFLKKYENDPIDIDTPIFDSDRKSGVERKQAVELTEKATYSVALDEENINWNTVEDMIGWLLEHPLEMINGDAKPLTREEIYASRKY